MLKISVQKALSDFDFWSKSAYIIDLNFFIEVPDYKASGKECFLVVI